MTLFRTLQKPLYWRVAPSKESITLPHNPARADTGISSSCFSAISKVQLAVANPKRTNVSPMTLPPAAAARSPAFVIPPFVPLRTGCLKSKKS